MLAIIYVSCVSSVGCAAPSASSQRCVSLRNARRSWSHSASVTAVIFQLAVQSAFAQGFLTPDCH